MSSLILTYSYLLKLTHKQKQREFQNQWMKKLFNALNHEKVNFTFIPFFGYKNSVIEFWSIIVAPNGIKSEPENEFESLGSQKVEFYALGKNLIFHRKMGILLKFKILKTISQIFTNLEIGHHFLTIFG